MNLHDTTELALQDYTESRTKRALLRLFPGGGLIDGVLSQTYANMTQAREEQWFGDLAERRASLKEGYAKSNTFVRRFMVTYDAVLRETENDKVELFANLLTNAPTEEQLDESTYKSLQQILNELSVRELALLQLVEDLPNQNDDWSRLIAVPSRNLQYRKPSSWASFRD